MGSEPEAPSSPEALERAADAASRLYSSGEFAEADRAYDGLRAAGTSDWFTAIRSGEIKLARGDYTKGWPLYEKRLTSPQILQDIVTLIGLRSRGWNGQAMPDGTLLVFAEQGSGDNLMALRFLPSIARQVGRVVLFMRHSGMRGLVQANFPGITVLTKPDELTNLKFDAYAMSMSLPAFLRATPETIPPPPYIRPDAARVAYWKRRLDGPLPAVGLCWQGNPQNIVDVRRSIAAERMLAPLRDLDFRKISLVRDAGPEHIAALPDELRPLDLARDMTEWSETAAIMAALDMVVTVDTSIAHLAGALGKPCIVLAHFPPYWPWGVEGPRTPWYPSARVVRGRASAQWDEALAEMTALLRDRFGPG